MFKDAAYFTLCKAHQLVKLLIHAQVVANVKATGHIIHRHGRNTGDVEPCQPRNLPSRSPFEQIEEVTEEAFAMRQVVIGLLPGCSEYGVGKVVIFVDQEIDF